MTEITTLTTQQISTLLAPYGITDIKAVSLLSGGSENTNYKVLANEKYYVLTICEQKSLQQSQQLAALLDYLAANNFTSSILLKTLDNLTINQWGNKAILVKTYIEGTIKEDLSPALLHHLGIQLGHLHSLKAPDYLADYVNYGQQKFGLVKEYAADSEFYQWLLAIQNYIGTFATQNLTRALIHSDIFCDNVIVAADQKQATIMDFEEAAHYYRIFDIGMMLVGTCCTEQLFDLDKAGHVLAGYQQNTTLHTDEIKALQAFTVYAAAATAFWRHRNYHYINRDQNMLEHYRTMQRLAAQIKALQAENFIEQLNLNNS